MEIEVNSLDEVAFWSRQFAEHALFVSKGLEAGRQELEDLGLGYLIQDGRNLYQLWISLFEQLRDGKEVVQEIIEDNLLVLDNYIRQVKEVAETTWIGLVFPEELEHYLEEQEYLRDYLQGKSYPPDKLLSFWAEINHDHAALFAHLLDPSEKEAFESSWLYQQLFEDLEKSSAPEIERYLELSSALQDFNTFTATLRESQALGYLKSIIHPRLALHIHREGLRALFTLERLRS